MILDESLEELDYVNGIRSDVAAALKHIKIPVLRWPSGCFAYEYHWMDSIGEKNSMQLKKHTARKAVTFGRN